MIIWAMDCAFSCCCRRGLIWLNPIGFDNSAFHRGALAVLLAINAMVALYDPTG
jgi:hypothetical protein